MPLPSKLRSSVQNQSARLLQTGSRFKSFNQIRQRHFWSSYMFIPDVNGYLQAGDFPVFVTPSGSNGQGFPSGAVLTDRETNWKSQNRVPDNQNLEVTELGVSVGMITPSMDPADTAGVGAGAVVPSEVAVFDRTFQSFLQNTIVNITYLTNSVPLGLCADFGQASAPHIGTLNTGDATAAGFLFRSNGFPAPGLRRRFKIPILLQHGETFAFSFNVPRSVFIGPVENNAFVARLDLWATESFVEKS